MSRRTSRRQFGALAAGTVLLAGCSSNGGGDEEEDSGTAVYPELRLNDRVLSAEFPVTFRNDETGQRKAQVQGHPDNIHWHYQPLEVPAGDRLTTRLELTDTQREPIEFGPGEAYQVDISLADDTPDDLVDITIEGDLVHFDGGSEPGFGFIVLDILEDGEIVWTSPDLELEVVQ